MKFVVLLVALTLLLISLKASLPLWVAIFELAAFVCLLGFFFLSAKRGKTLSKENYPE